MALQDDSNFQLGFILVMLSVGVKLAGDTFNIGIALWIVSGLMAFVLIAKGLFNSTKK